MKIIVLEGIDGSGKSTLAKRLEEYLQSKHIKTKYVHFPDAEADTGKHIYSWLHNKYAYSFHSFNFAAQHMLYALDRYEWFLLHEEEYKDYVLICDRYTTSSMIYQAVSMYYEIFRKRLRDGAEFEELEDISFKDAYMYALTGSYSNADYFNLTEDIISKIPQWYTPEPDKKGPMSEYLTIKEFVNMILRLEYATLKIPVPDIIYYIKSDLKLSKDHMSDKTKDAFESENDFMEKVSEAADFIASTFNWKWVDNTRTLNDAFEIIKTRIDEELNIGINYLQ